MTEYVIGLDIGTTCTKCVVIDRDGKIVGQGSSGYELLSQGNCVEQSAQDWIDASALAIRQATEHLERSAIVAISCSTQGGSTVAIDSQGNFLGNAWTWMDTRSQLQVDELGKKLGNAYFYKSTGSQLSAALDAAKLRNMEQLPQFQDAQKYYTTLEVINGWLTGNPVIDPSNAAMRQLYSIDTMDWDDRILDAVGITRSVLPDILAAGDYVGNLSEAACKATGLPNTVRVYNGAHDQYCASIGSGAIHDGDMLLSAGTTWVLMGISKRPLYTDSYIMPGKHPIDGLYGAIASLVGSGASMQWFHDQLTDLPFDKMNREVPARTEKVKDLFFLPYLTGAPFPIRDPKARGAFVGLTLEHDRIDMALAVMEGIAFGVRRAVADFAKNGTEICSIKIMGGASKSEPWIRIISAISGVTIYKLNTSDACALGAAMIASCATGWFSNLQEASNKFVQISGVYTPDPENKAWYDRKFAEYDRLWSFLQKFYKGDCL